MAELAQRRQDIDIARAFAMMAVVLFHIIQYFNRYEVGSFDPRMEAIVTKMLHYLLIPVFLGVAGFVLAMGRTGIHTLRDYGRFEGKKFCRLILPFLALAVIHMLVKIAAPGQSREVILDEAVRTFIAPGGGLAGHLWFLYILMIIFLAWPVIGRLATGWTAPILIAALFVLAILPIPWPKYHANELLALDRLAWYAPMFVLGFWYGRRAGREVRRHPAGMVLAFCVLAAAIAAEMLLEWPQGFEWETLRRTVRMAGYLAAGLWLFWLSGMVDARTGPVRKGLALAGFHSYDIYLLHVALVGHPLVFAISRLNPGPVATYALLAGAFLVTYIAPIVMGKIIRRVPPVAFVVLGVPKPRRAAMLAAGSGGSQEG
jgi:surface polysaccharide O-acyltransferase-like enzyme